MRAKPGKPRYFETPDEFREWLAEHHATATELVVGFHETSTGRASMSWTDSVREALCFGWIDGVRRSLSNGSYAIRFTPRKPGSIWSTRNRRQVEELIRDGLMTPAGLAAFEARQPRRTGVYSFEQRQPARLDRLQEQHFRAHRKAWEFFKAQPSSYRRMAIHWASSGHVSPSRRVTQVDPRTHADVTKGEHDESPRSRSERCDWHPVGSTVDRPGARGDRHRNDTNRSRSKNGGTTMLKKVVYVAVLVSDQDRALDFYTNVIGLEKRGDYPTPAGPRFLTVAVKGQDFELVLWPGTPARGEAGSAVYTIEVEDIRTAFETLKSRGVRFEPSEVLEFPWGSAARFQDPDGNLLQVREGKGEFRL